MSTEAPEERALPATGGGRRPEHPIAGLSLALSPLLPPLRFLVRAGATAALRDFEPLVRRLVAAARPFARETEGLDKLEAAVQGFDAAPEVERRSAIAVFVRELGLLVAIPKEIADLARL